MIRQKKRGKGREGDHYAGQRSMSVKTKEKKHGHLTISRRGIALSEFYYVV